MGFQAPRTPRGDLILAEFKRLLVPMLTGTAGEGVYLNASWNTAGHIYSLAIRSAPQGGYYFNGAAHHFGSPVIHNGPTWHYATIEALEEHLADRAHSAGYHKGAVWVWALTNPVKFLEAVP
jgi:hypothetical protein